MNKPNVFFILIDAGGWKHTSLSGYKRDTTPFLREFARDAVYYPTAFSHSPISGLSIGSFMTSSWAFDHQKTPVGVGESRPAITKLLQQSGYHTALISANPYYASKFGYADGVNDYRMLFNEAEELSRMGQDNIFVRTFNTLAAFSWYRAAKEWLKRNVRAVYRAGLMGKTMLTTRSSPFGDAKGVNQEIFAALAKRSSDKPMYLQVQYMDLHAPNFPPDEYLTKFGAAISHTQQYLYGKKRAMRPIPDFSAKEREDIEVLYDACLAHIDQRIRELCDELKRRGIYDDSLIIISADHGEAFFEHGDLGHHAFLYEENIRVPLLVKYPHASGAGATDGRVASLIDIPATIVATTGIERPSSFVGSDLTPGTTGPVRDHAVGFVAQRFTPSDVSNLNFANYTIVLRTATAKLIVKTGAKNELYDLAQDPHEQNNLADVPEGRELYAHMQEKLAPYLQRVQATSGLV